MIHYNLVYLHQLDIFFSVKFTYRYTVYVRKICSSLDSPNSIKVYIVETSFYLDTGILVHVLCTFFFLTDSSLYFGRTITI